MTHLAVQRELTTPAGVRQSIGPGRRVAENLQAMPTAVKREVVKLLFTPGRFGKLTVAAADGHNAVQSHVRLDGKSLALPAARRARICRLTRDERRRSFAPGQAIPSHGTVAAPVDGR